MFASGVPTAEKPTAKKFYLMSHCASPHASSESAPEFPDAWPKYKAYLASTSLLIPLPPALYRPLPEWVKRTVLLDLPMFRFDEMKDGKKALQDARASRRE